MAGRAGTDGTAAVFKPCDATACGGDGSTVGAGGGRGGTTEGAGGGGTTEGAGGGGATGGGGGAGGGGGGGGGGASRAVQPRVGTMASSTEDVSCPPPARTLMGWPNGPRRPECSGVLVPSMRTEPSTVTCAWSRSAISIRSFKSNPHESPFSLSTSEIEADPPGCMHTIGARGSGCPSCFSCNASWYMGACGSREASATTLYGADASPALARAGGWPAAYAAALIATARLPAATRPTRRRVPSGTGSFNMRMRSL